MKVEIYRSISEVSEGKWDAIVEKGQIFCTYKYVEALEKSGINKDRCYYVVVYEGDEIIAHACIYFVCAELDVFARGAIRKTIDLVRRKWKSFLTLRTLECGSFITANRALSLKDGVDHAKALETLCHGVENLAKELRINFILFHDFYNDEMKFHDFFRKRRYMKIHNLPKAEIKIRWKSFDEYLNSMRSSYRCKIVKSMDKCAKADVSIQVMKNFSDKIPELKRLYDNVYDQAKEVKRERLPESFFQNINNCLGEKAVMLSAVKADKFIGYMFLLSSDKTLISVFPGLDYDYNKEYCIYFNLFYKTIELAIEMGMNNIDMGITTLDPKKDMGSSIVTLNMYMKHSNRFLNKIIPILFDIITPPDTTGPRNVFKEPAHF